jgi:GNAT superfamily N-acetyltransferase
MQSRPATIRRATVSDATAIATVHVWSWQDAYRGLLPQDFLDGLDVGRRRDGWARILAEAHWPRSATLVVDSDESVVGFAHLCPTRDDDGDPATVGEIVAIYLLSTLWSTGVGRRLMDESLDVLRQAGFREATLWVLDTNERARRFYESGGWLADGTVKQDRWGDVVLNEVRYRRPIA